MSLKDRLDVEVCERFGGRTSIGISLQMPPVRSSIASLALPPLKAA
jgi:hypothetical protein